MSMFESDPYVLGQCIQDAYNGINTNIGLGGPPIQGGNYDFSYENASHQLDITIMGTTFDPSNLGDCLGGRCGIFNSMDFSHGGGTFDVDTANVWFIPVGTVVHTVVDVVLGNTVWSSGIPR